MVVWPCRDLETKEGGARLVKRTNVNYIHGLAIKTACTLSCVKILGYLLKIINPLTLGQIKLCMDHVNKNPKKKNVKF